MVRRTKSPVPDRSTPVEVWALADVVNRLRRILRSSIRSEFPWERLPMAQVEILQRLAEEPGLRVTELAGRQKLAINTVSNVIQQMVLAGLVDRRVDQQDRRAVTVHLTDTGHDQLQAWFGANGRRLDAAFSDLAEKDRTAILATLPSLGRLVQRLERLENLERANASAEPSDRSA
ncbi:MarR family transcriptional regulator [Jatrophihabitans sp. DSM 44399]|uniref:MarR family transcriptional regulator n=1 Tax=Jatrophihabitans lederbergiae TaxID=3075547 RepID=A0ABU2JF23_9ACTN|nr:MarR family transcriptional regulator [Jatrophihabitans sp. DSM 44399]